MTHIIVRSLFVPGTPAPQGSKRGFNVGGKVVIVDDSKKTKPWREDVRAACLAHSTGALDGPLRVDLDFIMPRPKSRKRDTWVVTKPDIDKLVRSTLDAIKSAGWFRDDSQVVSLSAMKVYAVDDQVPGCDLLVEPIDGMKARVS